tara:strand:+ start:116 stop:226 length:111 start_codon:yes stop_codon:yes gene_type:complete
VVDTVEVITLEVQEVLAVVVEVHNLLNQVEVVILLL